MDSCIQNLEALGTQRYSKPHEIMMRVELVGERIDEGISLVGLCVCI